jgi:HEAT repeat protein
VTRALLTLLVLLSSRCSSPSEEPPLFDTIGELRARYDAALDSHQAFRVEVEGGALQRLVRERFGEILQGLESSEPATRQAAAFALGFSRNRAALDPLSAATASPSPALRAHAIVALGMLGFRDVPMEPFRTLLRDDVWQVRHAALFGLRHLAAIGISTAVLEAVRDRLADPVMGIRNEAVLVLAKAGGPAALEMILARPVEDPEALVRQNAARALGAIRKPAERIVPALKRLLSDEDPSVVRAAEESLRWVEAARVDTPPPDR